MKSSVSVAQLMIPDHKYQLRQER